MKLQSIKNKFDIIGNNPKLNHALKIASQVANTDLNVLINGESGVGKEVFSQIIHHLSHRKHNSFIAVNCGAIPEGTIDSELFGHEKGAFTSATDQRKGYFETVNGGTIFLDEIGELPLGTQARLLRVLETGEYIRVGSSKVLKTDVRIVAATNKDLLELTKKNKFREDLYYRLNTIPIIVPPLRERKEDIPLLFKKFAGDFAEKYNANPIQLTSEAEEVLKQYPFPGNVRELKNITEKISVLSTSPLINADELLEFLPKEVRDAKRLLPAIGNKDRHLISSFTEHHDQFGHSTERELLYKILFDLRTDMHELKQMMLQVLQNANSSNFYNSDFPKSTSYTSDVNKDFSPLVISGANQEGAIHEDIEEIEEEESLSLVDKEKELIAKALKKHKGKRKDAAEELGISERTLYRKIKEYDIKD